MKYEWKKQEKEIYLPKTTPTLVDIPASKYFCIKGKGNPNDEDFSNRIGVLYTMSYAVRMMPKNGYTPDGYYEYTVYPLEGLWELTEEGRKSKILNKDELLYTIMIKQPDFVNQEIFKKALEISKKKKPNPLLEEITFERNTNAIPLSLDYGLSEKKENEKILKISLQTYVCRV